VKGEIMTLVKGETMILENESFHKLVHGSVKQILLVEIVNIGDIAVCEVNGSVNNGEIRLISYKGVNISTPWGDKFYKWYNVKSVLHFSNDKNWTYEGKLKLPKTIRRVPEECYEKYGQDLDSCSTQENEGCGRCHLFK
jgi:hypothetical protein